jgi:hypothetical protein
MTTVIYILLAAAVGIAVGAVLHAWFAKEEAATKTEVQAWAEELRKALAADATAVRGKIESLAAKLEAKL